MKKTLKDFDFYNKRAFVRVDFNVPIKDGIITDDLRIIEALPTIKYLINRNAKIILCSHLGRPNGKFDKKYSLKVVLEHLKKLLPLTKINFVEDLLSEETIKKSNDLDKGEIMLLENIRFYEGEEKNDEEFSKSLSKLADIFVLDAFGTVHRKHSSTYGIAKYLPSCMGLLVEKEIDAFDKIFNEPKRPLIAILGGAKVGDKLDVTMNLLNKVDIMLIGGGMCFTFLKALKANVGKSIVDETKVDFCYNVIKTAIQNKVKIILPVDFVCSKNMQDVDDVKIQKLGQIEDDYMGLDIGPKTVKLFNKYIKKARTLVWNGPLGVYEYEIFSNGTKCVAESIVHNKKCKAVVGGGDVVSAIENLNLSDKFYHVSTGGGASLVLLEGKDLVAVSALSDAN